MDEIISIVYQDMRYPSRSWVFHTSDGKMVEYHRYHHPGDAEKARAHKLEQMQKGQ